MFVSMILLLQYVFYFTSIVDPPSTEVHTEVITTEMHTLQSGQIRGKVLC